jgi:putative lipoprotein
MVPGIVLIVTLLAGGCAAPSGQFGENSPALSGVVTGSVGYRERIALPPDAVLQIALLDVSRMDVAATVIAEKTIVPEGQVPIPFDLAYDTGRIDARLVYAVRATIRLGDNSLFVTDTHYPVLTRGHGESVDLVLVRSGGGTAAVADAELSGTRWLLRTLGGEAVEIAAGERAPYLQFESLDGAKTAHGFAGCNSFNGGYLVAGATLSFEKMIMTLRACPNMTLEDRYLEALGQVNHYLIESSWLILSGSGGELATFEAWYE